MNYDQDTQTREALAELAAAALTNDYVSYIFKADGGWVHSDHPIHRIQIKDGDVEIQSRLNGAHVIDRILVNNGGAIQLVGEHNLVEINGIITYAPPANNQRPHVFDEDTETWSPVVRRLTVV